MDANSDLYPHLLAALYQLVLDRLDHANPCPVSLQEVTKRWAWLTSSALTADLKDERSDDEDEPEEEATEDKIKELKGEKAE